MQSAPSSGAPEERSAALRNLAREALLAAALARTALEKVPHAAAYAEVAARQAAVALLLEQDPKGPSDAAAARAYYDAHREEFDPRSFDEARGDVLLKLRGQARIAAREAMIAQLGGVEKVTVDASALDLLAGESTEATDATAVMHFGGLTVDVAFVRAAAPAPFFLEGEARSRLVRRLREDLLLWSEAKRRGLTERPEIESAKRAVLGQRLHDSMCEGAQAPTDDELRDAYQRQLDLYTTPAKVRAAAVTATRLDKAEGWLAQLRKARDVRALFAKLVAESEDPAHRSIGGELGWIDPTTTNVAEPLKRAVLALPGVDALSPVVASDNVFHVLLCLEIAPKSVTPFEQVKSDLFSRELRQRCEARYESLVRELQAQMSPEFDDQALARLAASVGH